MDILIEALRPSAMRNGILASASLLIVGLYVGLILVSPNSLLVQMIRGHGGREEAVQSPTRSTASAPGGQAASQQASDDPPALLFRDLPADQSKSVNKAMPLWSGPNPAAEPFKIPTSDTQYAQAVQCMTEAVYYEAGFEPLPGAQAVAQVVINRLRHPRFPKTICGVVFQGYEKATGCQFSFACDGSRQKPAESKAWTRARAVAELALSGFVARQVGSATHYHADYVVPYWMPTMNKLTVLGRHIFYRWPGPAGGVASPYSGSELTVMILVPPGAMTPARMPIAPIVFAPLRVEEVKAPEPVTVALEVRGAHAPHGLAAISRGDAGSDIHGEPQGTVDLVKPELPVLTKLSTRPAVAAPPPALMLSAPCAGPSCGAWR